MKEELVVTNARLVLEDEVVLGSMRSSGAVISDIGGGTTNTSSLDFEGDYLLPGLVELHTDHFEKQLWPRAGVEWPAISALLAHDAQLAAAGITTVFDAVAVGTTDEKPERIAMLAKALDAIGAAQVAGVLRAEHFIHLRCEVAHPRVLELFEMHAPNERLKLISLMDHTPGARQYADIAHFRTMVHEHHGRSEREIDDFIATRQAESARYAPRHREAVSREAKRRGLGLASHDDANAAHIEEALDFGVTIAEFPTTLEAARAAHAAGLTTVMGAPNVIRGGSHSGNVAAVDLARERLLDALSSDYMPISLIEAPFRLTREAGLTLPQAIALVSYNPARMAGLNDRGRIAPGLNADFVRIREVLGVPVVISAWRNGKRII